MTTTHTAYDLARLADCLAPDRRRGTAGPVGSPGAEWLHGIADAVADTDWSDLLDLLANADAIVSVAVEMPTDALWRVFVDLGAYREDISARREGGVDMTDDATYALGMIAARLVGALWYEAKDADDQ